MLTKSGYVAVATGLDDHRLIIDCTSWQLGNGGPWSGTSEMAFVANTKGASALSFADDKDTPLFMPADRASWTIGKGNSGNRDPREECPKAVDWAMRLGVFNPT